LQAIATAYRVTPTTNTNLSPHEVVFGRPMKFIVDWTLPTADTPVTSAEQYAQEIAPKLEILSRIAMDNAAASAGRHRLRHDEGAINPEYAVGDKVLLHNVTLKRGESIKLKRRYTGPFIITECKPGFNYKLQHIETGRDLKRAVHADRLRPLKEMPNDYRLKPQVSTTVVTSASIESLTWQVTVGEPRNTKTKALVYWTDDKLSFLTELTSTLRQKLSNTTLERIREHKLQNSNWQTEKILAIEPLDVDMTPDVLLFAILPELTGSALEQQQQQQLQQAYLRCLEHAEQKGLSSIAITAMFSEEEAPTDAWALAQAAAEALEEFAQTHGKPTLSSVEFVRGAMVVADVFATVFNEILGSKVEGPQVEETLGDTELTSMEPAPNKPTTEWNDIDCVLKRQKKKGDDMFLVRWKATKEET
jgi:O-acetyl-ADP-ribose deacetylase (regulator of RNase III)